MDFAEMLVRGSDFRPLEIVKDSDFLLILPSKATNVTGKSAISVPKVVPEVGATKVAIIRDLD